MLRPEPERALRRLVTQLAIADPDDIKAVLEGLDAARGAEIRRLLDDYAGVQTSTASAGVKDHGAALVKGLSPWLADRVAGPNGSPLTPTALGALRSAALAVQEGRR